MNLNRRLDRLVKRVRAGKPAFDRTMKRIDRCLARMDRNIERLERLNDQVDRIMARSKDRSQRLATAPRTPR